MDRSKEGRTDLTVKTTKVKAVINWFIWVTECCVHPGSDKGLGSVSCGCGKSVPAINAMYLGEDILYATCFITINLKQPL